MPPSDTSPAMTPLAPSVEKAYYRKCIQLKRRLNEVEAANDEARLKRVRLDRAIMKMRLERAFLLDELRRRMDVDIDGSDGSGDEGMATPPPDRPHRDKRRRHQQSAPASNAPSTHSVQSATLTPSAQRTTAEPNASTLTIPGPGNQAAEANPATEEGRYVHGDPAQPATQGRSPLPSQPPALSHESPHNQPQTAAANANATNGMDIDGPTGTRESGSTSKPNSTRPATVEENGDRAAAPSSTEDALSGDQEVGRSAFTAVNNH